MPAVRARPPTRPAVRLLPVPPLDPPYDDECEAGYWIGRPVGNGPAGDARVSALVRTAIPAGPRRTGPGLAPATRSTTSGPVRADERRADDERSDGERARRTSPTRRPGPSTIRLGRPSGRAATSSREPAPATPALRAPLPPEALAGATPEAKRASRWFLDRCLEIVNGYRPVGHARSLCGPAEAASVVEQLSTGAARLAGRRRPGRPAAQVRLRRLRVCEPRTGVAEGAAVLDGVDRTWAMTFRIERRRGSWVAVWVELL